MADTSLLVVEDESIVAMDIKHRAEGLGYKVMGIASSGEEAISKTGEFLPDLILMDIVLKGKMDGVQAAQIIRDVHCRKWGRAHHPASDVSIRVHSQY